MGGASSVAQALPILWTANVIFGDSGTVGGNFVFDADSGAIGTFSSFNITTQGGSSGIGPNSYSTLIQQASFFVRLVQNPLPDLTGRSVLTLAWVPQGGLTQYGVSPGLGDAGGLLQAIGAREEVCASANCSSVFGGPARLQNGFEGVFSGAAVPEPSSLSMIILVTGLLLTRSVRFLQVLRTQT